MKYTMLLSLLLVGAWANAADTCQTNIRLTHNNQPTLQASPMSIYQGGKLITSTVAHQWSVSLNCGCGYTLNAGGKQRQFCAGANIEIGV